MHDYVCQRCGGSWSLPLGMTCADHRPKPLLSPRERWGTCCPDDPECSHSFLTLDELSAWMDTPISDARVAADMITEPQSHGGSTPFEALHALAQDLRPEHPTEAAPLQSQHQRKE
jgi:hypothetical protein